MITDSPATYREPKQAIEEEKRKQDLYKRIECVCNEMLTAYKQDPNIKFQFFTKTFLKSLDTVLNQIRFESIDTEKFQTNHKELVRYLISQINRATPENPAEKILHPVEMKLVFIEHPELIAKCDNAPEDVQNFVCNETMINIKYIRHPSQYLLKQLDGLLQRYPGLITRFPIEHISLARRIAAINKGLLPIQQFNKVAFLKNLQEHWLNGLTNSQLLTFIKNHATLFNQEDFKFICKIAAKHKNREVFQDVFEYIESPDDELNKYVIHLFPLSIGELEKQTTELQNLALKSIDRDHLKDVYNKLKNPSPKTTTLYQLYTLYNSKGNKYPLNENYDRFKNPAPVVTEMYQRYLVDCMRYEDLMSFNPESMSNRVKQRFQKKLLITTYSWEPEKLKDAYKIAAKYPMSERLNYIYAILTATYTIRQSFIALNAYKTQDTFDSIDTLDKFVINISKILSDLITAAKRYNITERQLFDGDTMQEVIDNWVNGHKIKITRLSNPRDIRTR